MAGGIISELLEMLAGKFLRQVLNENVTFDAKQGFKIRNTGNPAAPAGAEDFRTKKASPKGMLPAGLYAMLDIGEGLYSVLLLSYGFRGQVTISAPGGNETINVEPGTWVQGKSMELSRGMLVRVSAGGGTQELVTNYGSFQAIGYGEHAPAGEGFNMDTVFRSGEKDPARKITGVYCISENEGEMYCNPKDPHVAWFAVSTSENTRIEGGTGVDVLKKGSFIPGKTYYLYAFYYDETMNFMGGAGGERLIFK